MKFSILYSRVNIHKAYETSFLFVFYQSENSMEKKNLSSILNVELCDLKIDVIENVTKYFKIFVEYMN